MNIHDSWHLPEHICPKQAHAKMLTSQENSVSRRLSSPRTMPLYDAAADMALESYDEAIVDHHGDSGCTMWIRS